MRALKLPNVARNSTDGSILLSYLQPKYTLLWLHGFSDTPDSYLPFFTHLLSPLYIGCRIKLLQAPKRTLIHSQAEAQCWYDPFLSKDSRDAENQANQLINSCNYLQSHAKDEINFWKTFPEEKIDPQHRIYIGGMGQGGSMALHYSQESERIPAGVISINGKLNRHTKLNNAQKMPALLIHGLKNEIISEIEARRSYSQLLRNEFIVDYSTFQDLSDGVNLHTLNKLTQWLEQSHTFIKKHYQNSV